MGINSCCRGNCLFSVDAVGLESSAWYKVLMFGHCQGSYGVAYIIKKVGPAKLHERLVRFASEHVAQDCVSLSAHLDNSTAAAIA